MSICHYCQTSFTVDPADQAILAKLDLPEPQLCAEDSLRRRLSFRNERHLYRRQCEMCQKSILAMFAPDSYAKIYCRDCWFSDQWDPASYARDYDHTRPFMDQMFELMQAVPHYNLSHIGTNENCDYTNYIYYSKDTYLSFSNFHSEGNVFCKNADYCKDSVDSFHIYKSELLYDCVGCSECYRSAYLTNCAKSTECYLGRDLYDCQNCFGCVNLKHKQYYWYNEALTKEEYTKRFQEALSTRANLAEHLQKFTEFALQQPVEFGKIKSSENVSGQDLERCTNIRNGFNLKEDENMGDCFRSYYTKDCYRLSYSPSGQYVYEYLTGEKMYMVASSMFCGDCSFVNYAVSCYNCEYLFGCVGLRKKKYCILNKQYSKEEYEKLRAQIVASMKADGSWGEFFETQHSPQKYNETLAYEYFPVSRETALQKGWAWQDEETGTRGKETIKPEKLPDTVAAIPENIAQEILRCTRCAKNYKIQPRELAVLQKLELTLPQQCPDCRFNARFNRHYIPKLYQRQCQCVRAHDDHPQSGCSTAFQTTYAPERREIVYCTPCYQKTIN